VYTCSGTSRGAGASGPLRDRHPAWYAALPATSQAPGLARQAIREALPSWQLAQLEEAALLLVSELVTNAVRHARNEGRMIALRLETTAGGLRIEVHDGDSRWPQPGTPDDLDESGYGFVLVDALASTWGVTDLAVGKAVWAVLDTREP
jgi:anti-sigma regulatory factor (Ser/Thr protein kinase)